VQLLYEATSWAKCEFSFVATTNAPVSHANFVTRTASVVWWSEFLDTDSEVRVRLPALPYFLRSGGSGTGSTQPREYN
jgi:hypothetical protein